MAMRHLQTLQPADHCGPAADRNIYGPDLTHRVSDTSLMPVAGGGFSAIYVAMLTVGLMNDLPLQNIRVAVKVMRVSSTAGRRVDSERANKRVLREANVMAQLSHPNIAKFEGRSYHLEGHPAIIMKWYKFGNAAEYLARRPNLLLEERLVLISGIADGIHYLHTRTPVIVHGDLKAMNILIDDNGHAVLTDFGISRVLEDLMGPTGNTTSSERTGTTRWLAPELFVLDPEVLLTTSTDMWAYACTAYELLTEKLPYCWITNKYTVASAIRCGALPYSETDAVAHGPIEMWPILTRCWALNPQDRPDIEVVRISLGPLFDEGSNSDRL